MRIRCQTAFTLVEVILSVVVLSVGIVTVYRPLLSSLDAMDYADSRLEMDRLISNQIFVWEQIACRSGKFMDNGKGVLLGSKKAFRYYADTKTIGSKPLLQEAKVVISWEGLGRRQQAQRDFYVLGTQTD